MANLSETSQCFGVGQDGRRFHVAVKATTQLYCGGAVSQMVATGALVPTGTAGSGPAIGKITHDVLGGAADGDARGLVETDRIFLFDNATAGDACADTMPIGAPVWASDDHTAANNSNSNARQKLGTFQGMEASGKVRVKMCPEDTRGALALQSGRGTFVAGVLTVNAGITLTANSRIVFSRVSEAGTDGDEIRCPDADRTVGGPGTGSFTARAFLSGVAATSDTSTFDWIIVG